MNRFKCFLRTSRYYVVPAFVLFLLTSYIGTFLIPAYAQSYKSEESQETEISSEYSLADLCRIALESAETIMISEQNVVIAERQKDKALSYLMPNLSLFGDYTRYSEQKDASSSFGSFTLQPESASKWGLRLDQSFSLGGREIRSYGISKRGINKSMHDHASLKEDYLLEVSNRYFNVLKAQKAVEIGKSNVERLSKYRDEAEIKLKVGEVTKTVLLRAEAELSGAKSDLVKADNLLELTRAVLARYVGIRTDFTLKAPDDSWIGTNEKKGININVLKETAFLKRPEMQSYLIQKEIAEQQVKLARGAYWPTLSIEGIYSKLDEDPSSPFFNDESIYGVISLTFPFFEGGLRRAEVREAEAQKKQAALQYEDIKKTIAIDVEEAYLNFKTQSGILESLKDQFDFAAENYRMVTKQFQYGLTDSLDVMDANNLLVTSELQLARAEYDYYFTMLQLRRATGMLLETVISAH